MRGALLLLLAIPLCGRAGTPLTGSWRSVRQSPAGRVTTMRFSLDSTVIIRVGLRIDYRYRVRGDRLFVRQIRPRPRHAAPRTYRMTFTGDSLVLVRTELNDTTVLRRADSTRGATVLGAWNELDAKGRTATLSYAPDHAAHLTWDYHTDTARYAQVDDSLRITLRSGTVLRVGYRLRRDRLQLFHATGEHPVFTREEAVDSRGRRAASRRRH